MHSSLWQYRTEAIPVDLRDTLADGSTGPRVLDTLANGSTGLRESVADGTTGLANRHSS